MVTPDLERAMDLFYGPDVDKRFKDGEESEEYPAPRGPRIKREKDKVPKRPHLITGYVPMPDESYEDYQDWIRIGYVTHEQLEYSLKLGVFPAGLLITSPNGKERIVTSPKKGAAQKLEPYHRPKETKQ